VRKRTLRAALIASAAVLVAAAIALALLHSTAHTNIMDKPIQISLGQQGKEVVKQSPVPIKGGGVGGLLMYDVGKYVNRVEPVVVLKEPYRSITFPVADNLNFYEDGTDGDGVFGIEVDLKLPPVPKSLADTRAMAAYDESVRQLAQEMIDRINQACWQRWIMFSDPRLSGRDTIAFVPGYKNRGYAADGQDMWGIDPSYRMTPEDWANLSKDWPMWYWIKNGASIEMRYQRGLRSPDVRLTPETLRITIKSADATAGEFYGPSLGDRMKYKQSQMLRMLTDRKQREAAAKAAGAKILEDYKDYPVGGVTLPEAAQ
jgi:hypothetical protein